MCRVLFLLVVVALFSAAISELVAPQSDDQLWRAANGMLRKNAAIPRTSPLSTEETTLLPPPPPSSRSPTKRFKRRAAVKLPYCDDLANNHNNNNNSKEISTTTATNDADNSSPSTPPPQNSTTPLPTGAVQRRAVQCPRDCLAWQIECKVFVCIRTGVLSNMELERPAGSGCHTSTSPFGRCVSRWDFSSYEDD